MILSDMTPPVYPHTEGMGGESKSVRECFPLSLFGYGCRVYFYVFFFSFFVLRRQRLNDGALFLFTGCLKDTSAHLVHI